MKFQAGEVSIQVYGELFKKNKIFHIYT